MDMNSFEVENKTSQSDIGGHQLIIGAQLLKVITNMHHIDELLQWIATVAVQRFQAHVAEIWALQQMRGTAQFSMQLRTLVCLDASLPQYIVTNDQVGGLVERLFRERRSVYYEPVNKVFSLYQASLFGRYGLHYCSNHFLSGNLLLPPVNAQEGVPTPFTISLMLFLKQLPHQNTASAINFLLERAVQAAGSRGLLLPMTGGAGQIAGASSAGRKEPDVAMLVPRRRAEGALLMSNNPFSRSVDIPDRQARRLYQAIDGRRNVSELAAATGMTLNDTISALQKLLAQGRVELFGPDGEPVASLRPGNGG